MKKLRFFASPFASAFRPPPRLPVAAGDRIIRPQLAAPLAPTPPRLAPTRLARHSHRAAAAKRTWFLNAYSSESDPDRT